MLSTLRQVAIAMEKEASLNSRLLLTLEPLLKNLISVNSRGLESLALPIFKKNVLVIVLAPVPLAAVPTHLLMIMIVVVHVVDIALVVMSIVIAALVAIITILVIDMVVPHHVLAPTIIPRRLVVEVTRMTHTGLEDTNLTLT